jgi:hypothetical protein
VVYSDGTLWQRQYFADERDVCRSNLIEIQIEDHNYEQKNGIHSDQQSLISLSHLVYNGTLFAGVTHSFVYFNRRPGAANSIYHFEMI